jgi:hypothetical protein
MKNTNTTNIWGDSRYSESVNKSCSTTDNRPVTLVTKINLMTIHERLKEDRIVTTPQIIRTGYPSEDGDRKSFEHITST